MKVYAFNSDGFHVGTFEPQLDPLESQKKKKKVYLIPPYSTEVAPPKLAEGEVARWNGKQWKVEPAVEAGPPSIPDPNAGKVPVVSGLDEVTPEAAREMHEHETKMREAIERVRVAKAKGLKAADSPKILEDVLFILGV